MDPVALGAVLLAVATGAGDALGNRLWSGVAALVRCPLHRKPGRVGECPKASSGQAEMTALQQSAGNATKAVELAEALLARAHVDPWFERALRRWWKEAGPVRASLGDVTSTISGGTFYSPVLQGRDFTDLTFGATSGLAKQPSLGCNID